MFIGICVTTITVKYHCESHHNFFHQNLKKAVDLDVGAGMLLISHMRRPTNILRFSDGIFEREQIKCSAFFVNAQYNLLLSKYYVRSVD
jgi:hypothetical protein